MWKSLGCLVIADLLCFYGADQLDRLSSARSGVERALLFPLACLLPRPRFPGPMDQRVCVPAPLYGWPLSVSAAIRFFRFSVFLGILNYAIF